MAPWNLFQSVSDPGTSVRMSKALGFRSKISWNSCQVFCIFWKCKFLMSLIYKITNRKSFVDLNFKEWVYEIYKSAYLDIIMISIFIKFTKESCTVFYYHFNSCVLFWSFLLTRSFISPWRNVRVTGSADCPGRNRRYLWPWDEYKSPIDLNWPDFYQVVPLDEDQFLVPIFYFRF